MLTKTFLLIIIFVLLSSIVVAQQIRNTADGLEYEGCLVQLKQKPVLDVTAGKERFLKDLDAGQSVVEHGLDVALQKNNFDDIVTLSEGVAVIINEEKSTVAEEKIVVDAQLQKIVVEQENFVKSSDFEQLIKDKLFLGMNGFLLDVDE